MTARAQALVEQVLELSLEERADVAAAILASLDGAPDDDAAVVWSREIERRVRRILSGESRSSAWEAVDVRMRARLGRR